MNRLTTDVPKGSLETALNLFFVKDSETWVRGYGNIYGTEDISLRCLVREIAGLYHISAVGPMGDDELDMAMADWLVYGIEEPEGVLALLYTAGWVCAELRARLLEHENKSLSPVQRWRQKVRMTLRRGLECIADWEGRWSDGY